MTTHHSELLEDKRFGVLDYIILTTALCLSTLIGVFYGFISKRKQNNAEEYLLGSQQMKILPVSMSLVVTFVSGITMLGVPAEMYAFGTQFAMAVICMGLTGVFLYKVLLPLFCDLQMPSTFTYLERRFGNSSRVMASVVYTVFVIITTPIHIYVPALAFNQVSGVSIHVIAPVICAVCIFYTLFGGMRAICWADTIQFTTILVATVTISILGLRLTGGFSGVWEAASRGDRLQFFTMDPDPLIRQSFWSVLFGITFLFTYTIGLNQTTIQRCLAVPDINAARRCAFLATIGIIFQFIICAFIGLIAYALYESCDPSSVGIIKKVDQIIPYFVMDVGSAIPGLPGLFIAAIFSSAMSTMAGCLNSLAATVYEDLAKKCFPEMSEKKSSNIMKIIVLIVGIIEVALVFVVEKVNAIMYIYHTVSGITTGPLLGLFLLGMFIPKANNKGAVAGAICSFCVLGVMLIGSQMFGTPTAPLPFSTDGCDASLLNVTEPIVYHMDPTPSTVPWFFRISTWYNTPIGILLVFLVGIPVSLLTGGCDLENQRLLVPWMRSEAYRLSRRNQKLQELAVITEKSEPLLTQKPA
ncbi:sodium-coupled monocarboxylate transporter 2-like [Lutzomyia longipalpis]|nr:sodium-coupled monocarboxylate transporter 2-like [Lutzomyia longipalpis]